MFTIRILTAFSCNIWLRVLHLHHSIYFLQIVRPREQKEPGSFQQWRGIIQFPNLRFRVVSLSSFHFFSISIYYSSFLLLAAHSLVHCAFDGIVLLPFWLQIFYTFFTISSSNFKKKKRNKYELLAYFTTTTIHIKFYSKIKANAAEEGERREKMFIFRQKEVKNSNHHCTLLLIRTEKWTATNMKKQKISNGV